MGQGDLAVLLGMDCSAGFSLESHGGRMPRQGTSAMVKTAVIFLVPLLLVLTHQAEGGKVCPVFCDCYPDKPAGPWAVKAECVYDDMRQVPRLKPNITNVHITSKGITELDRFSFWNSPSMRVINFKTENLAHVGEQTFHALNNLSSISITSKKTLRFEKGAVGNLPKLQQVRIIGNLSRIPSDSFCETPAITSLNLVDNAISSVDFDLCVEAAWQHLFELTLTRNPLGRIQAANFFHLRHITLSALYMGQCGLVEIQADLFTHLHYLKQLDLGHNKIHWLPPGVFANLTDLTMLVLEGTYLAELPLQEMLPFIPRLNQLNVKGCKYMNLSFGEAFLNATKLETLIISSIRIGQIGDTFFSNLARSPIQLVRLEHSSIREVSVGALRPFNAIQNLALGYSSALNSTVLHNVSESIGCTRLDTLSVNGAGLVKLDAGTFGGFCVNNTLTTLFLQNNKMAAIESHSFLNLGSVTTLNLNNNLLSADNIEDGAFTGMRSLLALSLDKNSFNNFPNRIRLGISSTLRKLHLEQNGLKSLTVDSFRNWENLSYLSLRSNNIQGVGAGTFKNLKNLTFLNLASNRIYSMRANTFSGLVFLRELYLRDNKLSQMPNGTLQSLVRLEELHLESNADFARDARTSRTVFKGMRSLKILSVAKCSFRSMPTGMFSDNKELEILQLSRNDISSWEPEVFQPLKKLTMLTMNSNQITMINKTSFIYLESLRQLDLSKNPFACTCDLLWFKEWILNGQANLMRYESDDQYTCNSPQTASGIPLMDFQITEEDCTSNVVLHAAVVSCSVLALVCVFSSLIYRYRWYLRYYIYMARSYRRRMQEALLGMEDFRYDVYVCYHNTSRHWVIHSLLPELEYRGGIKLCLHDRDWLPGYAIMDNIIESIARSRKTLLLVNNGFAKSVWCREETCLAYYQLVQDQRNLLVVVLLEDVQPQNMDKTLRAILSSRTYLAWNEDVKKEARFWKALRAALRRPEHSALGIEMNTPA